MNTRVVKLTVFAMAMLGFLIQPGLSYADDGNAVRDIEVPSGASLSCPAHAAAPAVVAPAAPEPTFLAARWCCLAEWQPGPCNSSTQWYASLCTNACGTCGAFSCISKTTSCLK